MNHRTVFDSYSVVFVFYFNVSHPVNLTISVVILSVMVVEFSKDTAGITKMNMPSAPVCIKRRLDITAFSCFCEHFFDQLCSFFHLEWAGLIVVVHFFQAGHLETYKFFDVWIKKIPAYKA